MPMSASSLSLPGSAHTTPEQPTTRVLSHNNPPAAPSYPTMGHGTSISALASAALSPSYTQSAARPNAAGRKATFTSAQMAPQHSSQPQTKKGKLNTGGAAARADSPLNSVSAKKAKLSASDVAGGSSCHQCKSRRSANDLTYCTSSLDKKKKSCRKKYCEHCLKKFYKESAALIATKKEWKCPSCRKLCCCAACRRKETKGKGGVVPSVLQSLNLPMSMALGLSKLTNTALAQSQPNKFGSSASASKPPLTAPPSALGTMLKSKDAAMKPESSSSYGSSSALLSPTLPGLSGEPPSDGAFKEGSRPLSPPLGPQAFLQFMTSNNQAQNQCFALLYAVANLPNVNKHIQYYLSRRDITDGQKVESIANLLRALAPSVSASN